MEVYAILKLTVHLYSGEIYATVVHCCATKVEAINFVNILSIREEEKQNREEFVRYSYVPTHLDQSF